MDFLNVIERMQTITMWLREAFRLEIMILSSQNILLKQ